MSDNPEYFVMLLCPNGSYRPMEDDDGQMKFLNTEQEARQQAISTVLGGEVGFEIFRLGNGEIQE